MPTFFLGGRRPRTPLWVGGQDAADGDAVVGDAIVVDAVVGDVVVGGTVVGDAVVGGAVVGDAVVGDAPRAFKKEKKPFNLLLKEAWGPG